MRGIGANALARILVLPVSAVLGLVLTRLVLDNYGEGAYAQYVLLAGVGALIPFADLGISVKTVETHRARLMEALGCRNAVELVRAAVQWTGRVAGFRPR